ncbi:MAG TPA: hypothetical protein VJO35_11745 [Terriglobales bacterium]|nr:hypothetical protein [Terriglobales bacterium]
MFRALAAFLMVLLAVGLSFGKNKKEKSHPVLPADVLQAQTVFVQIAPDAGEPLTNPQANAQARENVEKALMKWHRFQILLDGSEADLIITVRKGTGNAVGPTIKGGPIDQRPVILQPNDGDIRVGGHQGQAPDAGPQDPLDRRPHISTESGPAEDMMEVYRGRSELGSAFDSPPVWRYIAKDALRPPTVSAVDQFRKAIDESEKAAANSGKHP